MDKQDQDLPTQFPNLQQTGDNFHWHVSIDKSVTKIAGWVLGLLIFLSFLAAFAAFIAWDARDSAIKTEGELRLIDDWMQQHDVRKGSDGRYQFIEEKDHGE